MTEPIEKITVSNTRGLGLPILGIVCGAYVIGIFTLASVPFTTNPASPYPLVFKIGFPIAAVTLGSVLAFIMVTFDVFGFQSTARRVVFGSSIEVNPLIGKQRQYTPSQLEAAVFYVLEGKLDQSGLFSFKEVKLHLSFNDGKAAELTLRGSELEALEDRLRQMTTWASVGSDPETGLKTFKKIDASSIT